MTTFLEMQTELMSRLQVSTNSTLFPLATLKLKLNDAHYWATSLFVLPETVGAKKTNSVAGQDYYDYPPTFRTDTVQWILVDGVKYDRKAFEDFLDFRTNNSTRTDRFIFADFGRQIFIFPTPTANGTKNIHIYGAQQVQPLSADGDKTIFSTSDAQGNEAIVKKAHSVLIAATDYARSQAEEAGANKIMSNIYKKVSSRNQRTQRLDRPLFDVPNFFGGNYNNTEPGKFNLPF